MSYSLSIFLPCSGVRSRSIRLHKAYQAGHQGHSPRESGRTGPGNAPIRWKGLSSTTACKLSSRLDGNVATDFRWRYWRFCLSNSLRYQLSLRLVPILLGTA